MSLSQDLVNQFVKLTNDTKKEKSEVNVKGIYKNINGEEYVQLDGSDILTPVTSTVEAETGERVNVLIKDHTATVTGNISSPAARTKTVSDLKDEVDEHGNTIKQLDTSIEQQATSIRQINTDITQVNASITQANAQINQQNVKIQQFDTTIKEQGDTITSMNNTINSQSNEITSINNTITQQNNTINQQGNTIVQQGNVINQQGNVINQQGNRMNVFDSDITILNSGFKIEDGVLTGLSKIVTDELITNTLQARYANIDFANINYAAVRKIFADSGIIKDLVVQDQHITGELVGVTLKGDLIEGNTIKAEKLVVKGSDGLYYKLNIDGLDNITTEQASKFTLLSTEPDDWDTNYKDYYIVSGNKYIHVTGNTSPTWVANTYYKLNSDHESGLDGTVIIAKSVTADKVQVSDLVAFGATIGGFNITNDAIYSGVKSSVHNTTRGTYFDRNGQVAIGDNNNFIKYFYDTPNQKWVLDITAGAVRFREGETVEEAFAGLQSTSIKDVDVMYALSTSSTTAPTTGWSTIAPTWESGKYMWQKTVTTFGDDTTSESDPTCIQGAKGQDGSPGTPGTPGTNSYTHIRYSANSDGTNFVESPTTATIYIGVYTGTSSTAPTNKTSYKWSRYKGEQGNPGTNGTDGNGINSITYYYKATSSQIAPAASEITGTSIPTLSNTNKYLWQKQVIDFTDSSVADKTTVVLLGVYGDTGGKGDKGDPGTNGTSVAITSTSVTYQASSSGTTTPTGTWNASVPTINNGQYLWTRTIVNYSDGTTTTAYSVAYKGTNGANQYTHIKYSANSDGTSFVDNPTASTIYIGICNSTSATAPTNKTSYKWSKYKGDKGDPGQNGAAGNGINSITYYYKTTTTQTTPSAADITSTTIPTLSATNKYLWQKEVIDFTDSSVPDKTSVLLLAVYGDKGNKGDPGTNGTSITISSKEVKYQQSTSGTTIPTSTWNDSPSVTKGKYLWTRTIVNYSDGTNTTSYSVAYAGNDGGKGDPGDPGATGVGVSTITELYYLHTSNSSAPAAPTSHVTSTSTAAGVWTTRCPVWASGKYYWTCSEILYTNGTYKWSTVILASGLNSANSNATTAVNTVNNLEIGGRNLLRLSNYLENYNSERTQINGTVQALNVLNFRGNTCLKYNTAWQGCSYDFTKIAARCGLKIGDTITISQYIMVDSMPTKELTFSTFRILASNSSIAVKGVPKLADIVIGKWYQIYSTTTLNEYSINSATRVRMEPNYYDGDNYAINIGLYMTSPKLELGNKPTDWTPAPEDDVSLTGGRNLLPNSGNFININNSWMKNGGGTLIETTTEDTFNVIHAKGSIRGHDSVTYTDRRYDIIIFKT